MQPYVLGDHPFDGSHPQGNGAGCHEGRDIVKKSGILLGPGDGGMASA